MPTLKWLEDRYPQLSRNIRGIADLSRKDALYAIHMYKQGRDYAGRAVNQYGGTAAVITDAFRKRHQLRDLTS